MIILWHQITYQRPVANNETILGLTDGATQMFLHETGNDADGTAMTAFVKSGSVEIGEGNDMLFVQKLNT